MASLIATPRFARGNDPYDGIEPWLEKLVALPAGDRERDLLRGQIIDRCLPLAGHIARRYARRAENYDDLFQVASVGLVLAVDRFDPAKGNSFLSFAIPTIMGEVRHYFRDRTWSVHVPRGVKEVQAAIGPAVERLSQRMKRMPTASELAAELSVGQLEISHALLAANAYTVDTIDDSFGHSEYESAAPVVQNLGSEDGGYEITDNALAVAPLLRELPARERQVLWLRFFDNETQAQIAEHLGVSQMQVSRILSRTLEWLRNRALSDRPPGSDRPPVSDTI